MSTVYVDPDGTGDYTSLSAWESGEQTSLSEPHLVLCRCTGGTADPGKLTISGWTTSDSNYIEIRVDEGYRHNGTLPTSGNIFRCQQTSDGVAFRLDEGYIKVDGLAYDFATTYSRDLFETVSTTPEGWIIYDSCLAYNTGGCNRAFDMASATGITNQYYIVANCISVDMVQYGIAFGGAEYNNYFGAYNCTVIGAGGTGMRSYTVQAIAINCIVQDLDGTSDGWSSGWQYTSCTNVSDVSDYVGCDEIIGEVTFQNEGSDDFRLGATDSYARGVGVDMSDNYYYPYDWDCAGNTRSGYAWDAGAYQVTQSAPSEDINIVDTTGGGDYTSLSAWESGEQGDITTKGTNVIAVAECKGGQDDYNTNLTFAGWTTSFVNRVIVRNHASEPPDGTFNTGRYYIEFTTAGYSFRTDTMRHLTIRGIQIINNTNAQTADAQYAIFNYGTDTYKGNVDYHLINNVIVNDESANASKAFYYREDSRAIQSRFVIIGNMFLTQEDCLEIDLYSAAPAYNGSMKIYILNNTFVGDDFGVIFDNYVHYTRIYNTQWIRNNIFYMDVTYRCYYPEETSSNYFTDDDDYNDYNIDNHDIIHVARGSHGANTSGSITFIDSASSDESTWDVRLSESDTIAKGAGENLYDAVANFPQIILDYLERDITNTKRPPSGNSVAWDVGAHQVTPFSTGYHLMV